MRGAEQKLKLKQPLASATYTSAQKLSQEQEELLRQELNVISIKHQSGDEPAVSYDTTMTTELKEMGEARELIRTIQSERKKLGCSLDARVDVTLPHWPESQAEEIARQTLANKLVKGDEVKVKVV